MNVHFSYKISKTPDLEKLITQQTEKLERYLQVFRPELVHLKGIVTENPAPQGVSVSLNLRLPSGQMAAHETGTTDVAAVKSAFSELTEQLKKHKQLLRNEHKWQRRRGPQRVTVSTVPFEETIAAVKPDTIMPSDVSRYVNVNLPRLQRFIERELDHRVNEGLLSPGQIEMEDVVGEAIASALDEHQEKPERMKLEPWMHRLAVHAIDKLAAGGDSNSDDVPLESSFGEQNVRASDEAVLQFHQPDEKLMQENVIADPTANNPEELAARRELIGLVEATLRDAGRAEREAFIFYTIEGFTLDEIADITGHSVEEVRAAVRKAREHLQRAFPIKDPLKDKLVEYSKSA